MKLFNFGHLSHNKLHQMVPNYLKSIFLPSFSWCYVENYIIQHSDILFEKKRLPSVYSMNKLYLKAGTDLRGAWAPPGHKNFFLCTYFFHFCYRAPLLSNRPSPTSNCSTQKLNKNKA